MCVTKVGTRALAFDVLELAAEDLAYYFETLSLWCALLELNPQDFRQRVIRLSKKDGAYSPVYEVIELMEEDNEENQSSN